MGKTQSKRHIGVFTLHLFYVMLTLLLSSSLASTSSGIRVNCFYLFEFFTLCSSFNSSVAFYLEIVKVNPALWVSKKPFDQEPETRLSCLNAECGATVRRRSVTKQINLINVVFTYFVCSDSTLTSDRMNVGIFVVSCPLPGNSLFFPSISLTLILFRAAAETHTHRYLSAGKCD